MMFPNGGMGARQLLDGLSTTGFPTNAGGGSVEVIESVTPVIFWRRELLKDSGGPGRQRGGMGQHIVLESTADEPIDATLQFDRVENPAVGLFGGHPGGRSKLILNGTDRVPAKGRLTLIKGDKLYLDYAGGGGYGPPGERSRDAVLSDLQNGFISEQIAKDVYGLDPVKVHEAAP